MARVAPKRKKKAPPRRPVLGNDPFERGAATRAPAPQDDAVRSAPGAPPAKPPAAPDRPAAPAPSPAASPPAAPPGDAERRLAEVVRGRGQAVYLEEIRELAVRFVPALKDRLKPLASLARIIGESGAQDRHGLDHRVEETLRPFLDFLYDSWWRVELRNPERVPGGPAVVVANHGGVAPWDALMLREAARRPPLARDLRPLLEAATLSTPWAGPLAARLGAVPSTSEAALSILSSGSLLAVFPEGAPSPHRPWADRYRLRRLGRGGFARIAALAGVPMVPCAIVGSEESSAPIDRPGWLADAARLPILAAAPTVRAPALQWIPLPARWSIRFGNPVAPLPREQADDPAALEAAADAFRAELQRLVDEEVASRRSIFL